jgi:dipeptidyl aminopeptidase/acylaminoacyl peptidase
MVGGQFNRTSLLACFAALCCQGGFAADVNRPLRIDDLLRVESLLMPLSLNSAFSPDGRAVAFAAVRSPYDDPKNWADVEGQSTHSDIWVQRAPGEATQRVTDGIVDSSGWFAPVWSPDNQHLLVASTRGGVLRLWVLDMHGKMSIAASEPLDGDRRFDTVWVDPTRFLFCSSVTGAELYFAPSTEQAGIEWVKANLGREASGSAIKSSSRSPTTPSASPVQLRLANIGGDESRVVVDRDVEDFVLSPNKKRIAVMLSSDGVPPQANTRFNTTRGPRWLEVRDMHGSLVYRDSHPNTDIQTVAWSPDGGELAYWRFDEQHELPPRLNRFRVKTGRAEEINLYGLDPSKDSQLLWTWKNELVFKAATSTSADHRVTASARSDWYLQRDNRRPENMTFRLASPPTHLFPLRGGRDLIGVADGKLVFLGSSRATHSRRDHSGIEGGRMEAVEGFTAGSRLENGLALRSLRADGETSYYTMDDAQAPITHLRSSPTETVWGADDRLVSYAAHSGQGLFYRANEDGVQVIRATKQGTEILRTMDSWAHEIIKGDTRPFTYTSANGDPLVGCLILPPDYTPGRHYPLLTWIYAGETQSKDCQRAKGFSTPGMRHASLNMQLVAARGYAVILPSMPVKPSDHADDILRSLADGVLPVVDEVIKEGVADPNRVFVAGHSFGGFSTYGLVTQTNRFKAAVAMAGFTDLISLYGTVDPRYRYSEKLRSMFYGMDMLENSQGAMREPPWMDSERYIRGSPIHYVQQVKTPLLMIHGDKDFVPLDQAEEFFSSLYRQGKAAQLVRYWGEGHLIESPANLRDMWSRVFAWLDEFGDIARDARGSLIFDGDYIQSRNGAPPLKPEDFLRFYTEAGSP